MTLASAKNPEEEFSHIKRDPDYLVARSRALRRRDHNKTNTTTDEDEDEDDPYAAKAWMITAKLMYPCLLYTSPSPRDS